MSMVTVIRGLATAREFKQYFSIDLPGHVEEAEALAEVRAMFEGTTKKVTLSKLELLLITEDEP